MINIYKAMQSNLPKSHIEHSGWSLDVLHWIAPTKFKNSTGCIKLSINHITTKLEFLKNECVALLCQLCKTSLVVDKWIDRHWMFLCQEKAIKKNQYYFH